METVDNLKINFLSYDQIVSLDSGKQSVLATKDYSFSDFTINTASAGGAKYADKTIAYPSGYTKPLALYVMTWNGIGGALMVSLTGTTMTFVADANTYVGGVKVRVLFAK